MKERVEQFVGCGRMGLDKLDIYWVLIWIKFGVIGLKRIWEEEKSTNSLKSL